MATDATNTSHTLWKFMMMALGQFFALLKLYHGLIEFEEDKIKNDDFSKKNQFLQPVVNVFIFRVLR